MHLQLVLQHNRNLVHDRNCDQLCSPSVDNCLLARCDRLPLSYEWGLAIYVTCVYAALCPVTQLVRCSKLINHEPLMEQRLLLSTVIHALVLLLSLQS